MRIANCRVNLVLVAVSSLAPVQGGCFPGPLDVMADGRQDADASDGHDTAATSDGGLQLDATSVADETDTVPACLFEADCQSLDGPCINGHCDGGTCRSVLRTGGSCDDGKACTEHDTCTAGVCSGQIACPAIDACHRAGDCHPTTGKCTTPEKPDDATCDDGDICTIGESCQSGVCFGDSVPASSSDWSVGLETPGDVVLEGVVGTPAGGFVAAIGLHGDAAQWVTSAGSDAIKTLRAGHPQCGVYLAETDPSAKLTTFDVFAESTSCSALLAGSLGLERWADGTTIIGGSFDGPFTVGPDVRVAGTSPTAFDYDRGYLVARLDSTLNPIWLLQFLSFEAHDEIGPGSMVAGNGSHDVALVLNMSSRRTAAELVADDDTGVTIAKDPDGPGRLFQISGDGVLTKRAALAGGTFVGLAFADDGTAFVAAATDSDEAMALRTSVDSITVPMDQGDPGNEVLIAAVGPDDHIKWWHHFFATKGIPGSSGTLAPVIALGVSENSLWMSLPSNRAISHRRDLGTGEPLFEVADAWRDRLAIVGFDRINGTVTSTRLLGPSGITASTLLADTDGYVVVGGARDLSVGADRVGNGTNIRPFLARNDAWAVELARGDPDAGDFMPEPPGYFEPLAARIATGGTLVGGTSNAAIKAGVATTVTLTPATGKSVIYFDRVNANHWLDCR
ncbi:MAG: hypothetical protein U1F43_35645 [Myxococcota bacterium]